MLIKVRPPLAYWSWLAGGGPEKQVEKARPRKFQITIDIEGNINMNLIFLLLKKSAKIAENAYRPVWPSQGR